MSSIYVIPWTLISLCLFITVSQAIEHDSLLCEQSGTCPEASHTVIKLAKRDDELARRIAAEHGMVVKGQPFLDSHYFVAHAFPTSNRRKRSTTVSLNDHPDVSWVGEQRPKNRSRRGYLRRDNDSDASFATENSREKREQTNGINPDTGLPIPVLPFPDPLYADQWYLTGKAVGGYDMNVREAWALGYTGRNVTVTIIDDGIQRNHPDLVDNYDPLASSDIIANDTDPLPHSEEQHGTRCAGEVAAVAGNNHCGVGIAYHAKVGGIRMWTKDVKLTDDVEARSFSFNQDHIDIYSASWGPPDDGTTVDGPGKLAREALYQGVDRGRGGKGNIFVFASGNGGERQDSCAADGYINSVYTLSVNSATYDNKRPWYGEECPAILASTYSSSNPGDPAVVTTDSPSGCSKDHGQTSASAPMAAGIIALALEANPALTWRDMQHIVLRTANPTPLLSNPGWYTNGAGRQISNKFGYGLIDAGALVKLARVWKLVPIQFTAMYKYEPSDPNPKPLFGRFKQNFTLTVDGTHIVYLEHVQAVITVQNSKRGDLKLTLYSPAGTRSVLLPPRPNDFNSNGFNNWPFLSVQTWGEDPRGTWTLQVESVTTNPTTTGSFSGWTLLLYGTEEPAQPTDPVNNREPAILHDGDLPSTPIPVTSPLIHAIPNAIQALQYFLLILACIACFIACCGTAATTTSTTAPETSSLDILETPMTKRSTYDKIPNSKNQHVKVFGLSR